MITMHLHALLFQTCFFPCNITFCYHTLAMAGCVSQTCNCIYLYEKTSVSFSIHYVSSLCKDANTSLHNRGCLALFTNTTTEDTKRLNEIWGYGYEEECERKNCSLFLSIIKVFYFKTIYKYRLKSGKLVNITDSGWVLLKQIFGGGWLCLWAKKLGWDIKDEMGTAEEFKRERMKNNML
jgi:hypothetical protein